MPSTPQPATVLDFSKGDLKFIQDAANGGADEVALGQVAAERAMAPEVRELGEHMVADHTEANQEIARLVAQKGITLVDPANAAGTAEAPRLDSDGQRAVKKLTELSGAAFDREYVKMMVSDHEKVVKEFEDASRNAQDADVKAFAAKTLPILDKHLRMARDTEKVVKE